MFGSHVCAKYMITNYNSNGTVWNFKFSNVRTPSFGKNYATFSWCLYYDGISVVVVVFFPSDCYFSFSVCSTSEATVHTFLSKYNLYVKYSSQWQPIHLWVEMNEIFGQQQQKYGFFVWIFCFSLSCVTTYSCMIR